MKPLVNYINESCRVIKDPKLYKALKVAGIYDVELIKGDGYFYVVGVDGSDMEDLLVGAYDTSIYMNSFNQQGIDDWVADIQNIINSAKNR